MQKFASSIQVGSEKDVNSGNYSTANLDQCNYTLFVAAFAATRAQQSSVNIPKSFTLWPNLRVALLYGFGSPVNEDKNIHPVAIV